MDQQVIENKPRSRVLDNVVTQFVRRTVKAYFELLAKLPNWGFVLAVAVWTVVFKTALVPIVALLFVGAHDFNTVLIAFMISFFPIAVSVSIGLSTLEPEYRDILRSLGASQATIFWKIALPKTLPEFFGALKVAVTLAFIGTNLMEIVSPHGRGLGALFDSGKTNSDYPLMFAVLIALAFLGIVLYYVVVFLEKIFAGWAERQPT